MPLRRSIVIVVAVALLASTLPLLAEQGVVVLKDGTKHSGEVVQNDKDKVVTVSGPDGLFQFKQELVEKVAFAKAGAAASAADSQNQPSTGAPAGAAAAGEPQQKGDTKDVAKEKLPVVTIATSMGNIVCELFEDDAPNTVANFISLIEKGFYNGTKFHRVIKDFMIQGGDPNSKGPNVETWGTGGPGYAFEDEPSSRKNERHALSMANAGPNTNGSQFFIITKKDGTPWLDGKHTVFGRVIQGQDIADAIEKVPTALRERPQTDVVINKVIIDYKRGHRYEPAVHPGR